MNNHIVYGEQEATEMWSNTKIEIFHTIQSFKLKMQQQKTIKFSRNHFVQIFEKTILLQRQTYQTIAFAYGIPKCKIWCIFSDLKYAQYVALFNGYNDKTTTQDESFQAQHLCCMCVRWIFCLYKHSIRLLLF